jgi:NADPH-dependent 2,4-dienoyl-CoA reductase/sulfur reductase-like enzyme
MISQDAGIGLSKGGASRFVTARRVILATGAQERPFPISGWTLPGVMTAGAAQILLKTSGLIPDGRFVLVGTGPLLWLLANQLLDAGARPAAFLDTSERPGIRSLSSFPGFALSPYFTKGIGLMRRVSRDVPVIRGVTELSAEGDRRLSRVRWRQRGGKSGSLDVDALLLHQGVVPNVNLAAATGCDLEWDDRQLCFRPRTDEWGRTSVPAITVAGDGAGIMGAEIAALRGELAALDCAALLGRIAMGERDRRAAPVKHRLRRHGRGRSFLDEAFRPGDRFRLPPSEAIVCRCEEITAGRIRELLASLDVSGPNQLKTYSRCGMGPCQGRFCGLTVTEMIARHRGVLPSQIGYYRLRFPVKPITVAELASLPSNPEDVKAVVRL